MREETEYVGSEPGCGDSATTYYRIIGTNTYIAEDMVGGEIIEKRKKILGVFYPF